MEYGFTKDQGPYLNQDEVTNPSQEPPALFKAPNGDFKDIDVLSTFKFKVESKNLDQGCIKDQLPYPNQDQDAKTQSGTSSILQTSNEDLKDMDLFEPSKPIFRA